MRQMKNKKVGRPKKFYAPGEEPVMIGIKVDPWVKKKLQEDNESVSAYVRGLIMKDIKKS